MWKTPKKCTLVHGEASGETELESIDNALIEAGIGNLNLIKVTSIFPEKCEIIEKHKLKPGTITPTTIAQISSSAENQKISASISIAKSDNSYGVISEYKGKNIDKIEAQKKSEAIGKRMLENRGLKLKEIKTVSAEHSVNKFGTAIAAVVFIQ